jgi:hypothetical protein
VKWTWGPVGAYGLAVGLLLLAIATVIYRAAGRRVQVRLLTLLLIVEGFGWALSTGLMYLTGSSAATYAFQVVGLVFGWALPPVYLLFVGTLPSPLARPLRSRAGRAVLLVLLVGAPLWFVIDRQAMIHGVVPGTYSPWDVDFGNGILLWLPAYWVSSYLYGLVVGIDAFRRAPKGSEQRRQMRYFLAAFGTRDLIQMMNFGIVVATALGVDIITGPTVMLYSFILVPVTVVLAWAVLLSYAVLRVHLLDIDLRLKLALKGTTLTSFFVAAFLIVSQLVQNITSQFLGYIGGAVAAGVLLFALHPLQRVADRMANAAMPRVTDSPDYIHSRKEAVFSAALEGALQDGSITDKESGILMRLQLELGIANSEARTLEAKVRSAMGLA